MAIKLHEVHPSLVHFPIALYPFALAADLAGRISGNRDLMATGRVSMTGAAVTTAAAGVFGFIAQEEVKAGEARDLLVTHRTLNVGFLGLVTAMAALRAKTERPTWAYISAGLIGFAGLLYSSYLGGKMVYAHGVGVERAGGVAEGESPELLPAQAGRVIGHTVRDTVMGVAHTVQDAAHGEIAPKLRRAT